MSICPGDTALQPESKEIYSKTLAILAESNIPFLLGGAYALSQYMEFERHTRDLDVFVRRRDCQPMLDLLAEKGYRTDFPFPHWLGKAYCGKHYIDVIFSSGNAVADVDDECFIYAKDAEVLGVQLKVMPAEEIIWQKSFIMERERYDGADIAHLIKAIGHKLDWQRMLRRFGPDWRVLLNHLILFGYIYPNHREQVPNDVMKDLLGRLQTEMTAPAQSAPTEKICQGTILSREQYLVDTDRWGYADARLQPRGKMTADEIAIWTAAIASK